MLKQVDELGFIDGEFLDELKLSILAFLLNKWVWTY